MTTKEIENINEAASHWQQNPNTVGLNVFYGHLSDWKAFHKEILKRFDVKIRTSEMIYLKNGEVWKYCPLNSTQRGLRPSVAVVPRYADREWFEIYVFANCIHCSKIIWYGKADDEE